MFDKIKVTDFVNSRRSSPAHFLGRCSFEARSIEIPLQFKGYRWSSFLCFHSKSKSQLAESQLGKLTSLTSDSMPHYAILDISEPLEVARALKLGFSEFLVRASGQRAIIDITSFRREELLMLYALIRSVDADATTQWELVYLGAQGMGDWLSGKVTNVRSVYGFPGEMWPSKKTRLVLLMGFEVERARSIFEVYEPATVFIGTGKKSESISEELHKRNMECLNTVLLDIGGASVKHFEFSARDPAQLVHDLEKEVPIDPLSNTVIAPLNTKLSTLGVGLYALKHPEYQVCYASVDSYNEDEFSKPSDTMYSIPIKSLFN
jgi:hypothetical protein